MKILFLTISAGQGHHATANACVHYLREKGVECMVLDALEYLNPIVSESVQKGYLFSTQFTPGMYGGIYRLAEKKERIARENNVYRLINSPLTRKLVLFINSYQPDYIVATHIFAAQMVTATRRNIPAPKTVGIITDFTIHPFWEDTDLDYYVTASHLLNHQCEKKKIPLERVLPFGIPVHTKFARRIPKEEAREILGIDKKASTILFIMGSMGYGKIAQNVRQMDKLDMNFQVLCVCGNNKSAKRTVDNLRFNHRVYTYGFVDNVDVMMDAADVIITKAGGLTVSESLAKGLPLILLNPIPGQEDRNVEFLLNNGIATKVSSTFKIDEAIFQLLSNRWKSDNLSEYVKYLGKPGATQKFCDFMIENGYN